MQATANGKAHPRIYGADRVDVDSVFYRGGPVFRSDDHGKYDIANWWSDEP